MYYCLPLVHGTLHVQVSQWGSPWLLSPWPQDWSDGNASPDSLGRNQLMREAHHYLGSHLIEWKKHMNSSLICCSTWFLPVASSVNSNTTQFIIKLHVNTHDGKVVEASIGFRRRRPCLNSNLNWLFQILVGFKLTFIVWFKSTLFIINEQDPPI